MWRPSCCHPGMYGSALRVTGLILVVLTVAWHSMTVSRLQEEQRHLKLWPGLLLLVVRLQIPPEDGQV